MQDHNSVFEYTTLLTHNLGSSELISGYIVASSLTMAELQQRERLKIDYSSQDGYFVGRVFAQPISDDYAG